MLKKLFLFTLALLCNVYSYGQEDPIQIIEERVANRLMLHALNETDTDYDMMITVEGTDFRQSKAKPRLIRIPATSKVRNVARLMLLKGKEPNYTYKLVIKDSLSRRALRKEFKKVKIMPKKPITVYITENCVGCDSIMKPLEDSKWVFTKHDLKEKPEIADQLRMTIPQLDTIKTPVFGLGGLLFPKVKNYEELMEEMQKEE